MMDEYKPGSIRSVRLKNFLTYNKVEFQPGPRLNVVIGPNGTGKSTLLCALCLGLGGQPNLLGRADDARTFIQHNEDEAIIEIALEPHRDEGQHPIPAELEQYGGYPHVLRRQIDRNKGSDNGRGAGASTFYINNHRTNIKLVRLLVTQVYRIQIENMCTFLPQDKVGSFSGFNPQKLLVETEQALLQKWHDTHQTLIKLEDEVAMGNTNVDNVEDQLRHLEQENARLEREKEMMEQREEAKVHLEKCQQKRLWLHFDQTQEHCRQLKNDKELSKKELQKARSELRPLEERIEVVQSTIAQVQSKQQQLDTTMKQSKKEYIKHHSKNEVFQDHIDAELGNLTSIDSQHRQAVKRASDQRAKVEQMMAQLEGQCSPREDLEQDRTDANRDYQEMKVRYDEARKQLQNVSLQETEFKDEYHVAEDRLVKMNDEKARRQERIFRQNGNLERAHRWIDDNRKMFRHEVLGPISCEISTTSSETAAYLENHVSNSVLKSFVVQCKEDYNLLYREVRQKRSIPINVVMAVEVKNYPRPYTEGLMERTLKREHGILGYLDEFVTGPVHVLQALRSNAAIHRVLVGTKKTQESLDRRDLMDLLSTKEGGGKQKFSLFAAGPTGNMKYESTMSRYSSNTSTRVDEVGTPRQLAPGVPPEEKERLTAEVSTLRDRVERMRPDLERARLEHDKSNEKVQSANRRLKEAREKCNHRKKMEVTVERARDKLRDFEEAASKDNLSEKMKFTKGLMKQVKACMSSLEMAGSKYQDLMKATFLSAGTKMTEDRLVVTARKIQDSVAEKQMLTQELEQQKIRDEEDFKKAKALMKRQLDEARRLAPIKDDNQNPLPLMKELEKLPETVEEVDILIDECTAKINAISDNPEVLRMYEARKKEMEELRARAEGMADEHQTKVDELARNFDPWKAALTKTAAKVNVLFGKYMEELGCAGEVRLYDASELINGSSDGGEPTTKYNFKEWGMEIRVKFREKASLQVLSAQVQSGGERSVSTIMYLMAMQEMMSSPFRCVDEINQGLDEKNERLVFKRIVTNSTRPAKDGMPSYEHSGQYFLITPKLLPNLTDMEQDGVTILCIFNGHYTLPKCTSWKGSAMIRSRKRLADGEPARHDEDEEVVEANNGCGTNEEMGVVDDAEKENTGNEPVPTRRGRGRNKSARTLRGA